MKISELIAKLEEIKELHGDLDVYSDHSDEYGCDFPVEEILFEGAEQYQYKSITLSSQKMKDRPNRVTIF